MTITSETFYRAECDHNGCEVTLPDDPEANEYREPWCFWDHEKGRLR